ncbi:sulfite exporter TauE/SafE family protein [Caldibacillus lycopersici]|uniref:Probable membrane transporter protein n=1 Tax=Perspicuibacillus lycopersici TaxID=1325689 RepID=A0AAE3IRE2_9BACI|nr:sulfite exporter TauE/SafE family protein [Perspicuibacillus lycopersici]MCU9613051.1 sulfite exporter TauE/SafE family protein [Perspicuibacillus lycopersici]
MTIGIIYFFVIIFANAVGSLTGMGGGVIIKPIFDAIGAHSLVAISFYSCVAVLTMSLVSTIRQWRSGGRFKGKPAIMIIIGSIFGGILGNIGFEQLLVIFSKDSTVQWIQILLTIISLIFALLYTMKGWKSLQLTGLLSYGLIGICLGFLASLLGIGGGPINVAILMFFFGIPIKKATAYSILTILFSQLSKFLTIGFTVGYVSFDLSILLAIIPAAILGALIGAKLSKILVDKAVLIAYQAIVILVIILNISNGVFMF